MTTEQFAVLLSDMKYDDIVSIQKNSNEKGFFIPMRLFKEANA